MNIQISKEAAKWYRKELDINEDAEMRFYVRYGGFDGNIPGFSLGVGQRVPEEIHTSATKEGVTFFIEQNDAWYFEGKDLKINLNHKLDEPDLKYI